MAYHKLIPPVGQTSAILKSRKGTNNEIAIDPTTKEFVVYDGNTTGGIRMARKDLVEDLADSVKDLAEAINAILEYMETNNVLTKTTTSSS